MGHRGDGTRAPDHPERAAQEADRQRVHDVDLEAEMTSLADEQVRFDATAGQKVSVYLDVTTMPGSVPGAGNAWSRRATPRVTWR